MEVLTALSPWADVDISDARGIFPRPDTLDGKTIGMFAHFKEHSPIMLRRLEKLLSEKLPKTNFTHFQYPRDTREIVNDDEFRPKLQAWLKGVDAVIAAYGDAGSCAMFHAYNTAFVEKLGVPCVMLCKTDLIKPASRGASARHVPALRFVPCEMLDLSMLTVLGEAEIKEFIDPFLPSVAEGLIDALTRPLTEDEKAPPAQDADFANLTVSGNYMEINDRFYQCGWTNGSPIIPPTAEAVEEMLTGTELPRDFVVGQIPPMLGNATVEKIAINAVMAGCLPTYMPVLIAAVRGMLDPSIHLEGWTCSVSSWAPFMTVTGPAAKDIGLNGKGAIMSPYFKPSAAISRAVAYITMNIAGVRPTLEDMSELGHPSRFGVVITENDEMSPWPTLHTEYGFDLGESAITMFWPHQHNSLAGSNPRLVLESLCALDAQGWAPGAMIVMSPKTARMMNAAGWDKQRILDYMVEYNRQPGSKVLIRWLVGNNHPTGTVDLPESPSHWTRRFWSKEHLFIVVGGSDYGYSMAAFSGGGDHGGPSCTRIELPSNWDALVEKYADISPKYIQY